MGASFLDTRCFSFRSISDACVTWWGARQTENINDQRSSGQRLTIP